MLRTLIPIGILTTALAACGSPHGAAPCAGDPDCNLRTGGECRSSPLGTDQCAYPDTACAGGFSWSELSGNIAGECVSLDVDAGNADAGNIDAVDSSTIDAMPMPCDLRLTFQEGQEVWAANQDGTGLTNLSVSASADSSPQWSTAGAKIVFVSGRTGNDDVFTVNPNGSGLANLTRNSAEDQQPTWSRDGTKIAFLRSERLWLMDANGSSARQLSTLPVYSFNSLTWSPDGSAIAFVSGTDIYSLAVAGGSPRNLTNSAALDDSPEWSPDGTKIAFRSAIGSAAEDVFVMNVDGAGVANITNTPSAVEAAPKWSPDSSALVFSSNRDGNSELYRAPISTPGAYQRLTNTTYPELSPAWSPDGTKIAFVLAPSANSTIGVIDSSGSGLVTFALTNGGALSPSWAPCR